MTSPGGIPYQLVRASVKNINLRVRPDGTVRVSAPRHVSVEQVHQFVDSKAQWIASHQEQVRRRDERDHSDLREGDVARLWGRELPIRIETVTSARQEGAAQEGDALVLRLRSCMQGDDEPSRERRVKLVDDFLRSQLHEALPPLFQLHEAQMGVHASQVRLRRMRTRWGSCNTRTKSITINLQLAQLPPQCLEGVVVHELCHLVEPNHGSRFYALMDRHFPAWREVRAQLRSFTRM